MGFLSYIGPKVIIFTIIIAFGLTVVIAATVAKSAVDSAYNSASTSPEDKANYKDARESLGWAIALGWTLIALAIVILIVAAVLFFFGGDIAAAAAGAVAEGTELVESGEELLETLKTIKNVAGKVSDVYNDLKQATQDVDKWTRREQRGFLDFDGLFGGVLLKLVLLGIMGFFFALGILSAMAAVSISKTQDKDGYTSAIIAASFGIGPFALFLIWWITDVTLHYTVYKPKVEQAKKEQAEAIEEAKEIKKEQHIEHVKEKHEEAKQESPKSSPSRKKKRSSKKGKDTKTDEESSSTVDSIKSAGSSALSALKANTTEEQRKQLTDKVSKHISDHAGEDLAKAAGSVMSSFLSDK